MDTYNEKEIIALLQDPKRQREAFECIVKQYSEQLYWQIIQTMGTDSVLAYIKIMELFIGFKNLLSGTPMPN